MIYSKHKFIKSILFLFITAFSFSGAGYAQPEAASPSLLNFKQIDANLYRGGRPTEAGLKELANKGIKTVINLRNNKDDAAQEEVWTKAAGLNFYTVPLNIWFRPKDSQVKKIREIIGKKENQPVYVHCNLGADRTGMVVAIYRISHDGWTAKQANAEAKESGLGKWQFWMRDYINDYYRDLKKEKK